MNNKYDYYYDEEKNQIVYYNKDNNEPNTNFTLEEPPKKKRFFKRVIVPFALIGILIFSGTQVYSFGVAYGQKTTANALNEKLNDTINNSIGGTAISNTIAPNTTNSAVNVFEKVSTAVVSINTRSESSGGYFGFGGGALSGAGSGVIIHEDNEKIYIVTNNHVIDGAKQVTISLDDDTQVAAKFVGTKPSEDIAVISVSKQDMIAAAIDNYSIINFANSDNIKVGEDVLAIGNAAGEGKTATKGIISAIDKQISVEGTNLEVIQTDAAINPGNSGGALVNLNGDLVGINAAKYSSSGFLGQGAIEGMGYSIPANKVKQLVTEMISTGSTAVENEKPYLGIQGGNVSPEMKAQYGLPDGAIVSSVSQYSNIAKAGLRAGDIIIQVGDTAVTSIEGISEELNNYKIGDFVVIKVFREGKTIDIETVLQDYNTVDKF